MTYEQVNSKVVRVPVTQSRPVLARRGSMLGYSGQVSFRPVAGQGQGVRSMVGAALAGESTAMMVTEGDGSVLYGFRGLYTTVVQLTGDSMVVEADRLLVHDAHLQTSIEMVGQGGVRQMARGAVTGQGLFTTRVSGQGTVVLLSHGGTFPIQLNGDTVGVDPQAYVAHTGALQVELKQSLGMRDLIGRGSGEAFQLHVSGHGVVHVQASEEKF
ncbi:AIM24 family protein [Nocardioides sp. ChNu-153]|uniref:AIM24 family protein n=1 Tax=unclassified Nocardioides TaxID=2615069 RepID=UPI002404DCEB|nr:MULTISPECIES: AIM24 family protein [unclassified Nocardioides]MDF9714889.1 AIM24 family protein [Nocardioides sp. ChNu-99]MDN7123110.1 AIM24 family protein [Nocardioides sp. ChNu-153]